MAHSIQKFEDGGFKNWIKGALALIFCKEGLEDFVMDEMTQHQRDILQNIYTNHALPPNTICNSCTTANVLPCRTQSFCSVGRKCHVHDAKVSNKTPNKKCPNNICQNFSNAIRNTHRFTDPSWKNTDVTFWCTDAFYVAKCYLPPDGYSGATSIKEIDFNGVISVLLTNKRFQNKMAINLSSKTNTCAKARDVGRVLRHSPDMSIEDNDLNTYIDTLIDLLSDAKCLSSHIKAKEAVDKLKELKVGSIVITTEDVTKIHEDFCKAQLSTTLGQIQDGHEGAIESISEKERNIKEVYEKNTKEMNERKVRLLKEIREEMERIKHITKESLDEIIQAKETQVKELRQDVKNMLKHYGEEERKSLMETGDKERKSLMETSRQEKENFERFSSLILAEVQEMVETVTSCNHDTKPKSVIHKRTETNDSDYLRLKSELQEDPIDWCRDRYWTLPISPMIQENDANLLEFYPTLPV